MLDVSQVLAPDTGLVAAHGVIAPGADGNPLWSVGAQLACEHAPDPDEPVLLSTCRTGACSVSRSGATVRTAGEAVERAALHGAPALSAPYAAVRDRAFPYFDPQHSLGADPGHRVLRWYEARRVTDGRDYLVPAGLVDYPAAPEDRVGFDPGPSGAAAGPSYDAALKAALLETLERDAVIVSWARQLTLRAIDVEPPSTAGSDPVWSQVRATMTAARGAGLTPVFAEIPTAVAGVTCLVGGVRAELRGATSLCLGAKASDHLGKAVLGALEESFQLYYGLRTAGSDYLDEPVAARVTCDAERVRFLASARGVDALLGWLDAPLPTRPVATEAPVSAESLMLAMIEDGLDPLVLDLSERLPPRLRAAGWAVVKVIPAGYQPLRIDERHDFGWHAGRLDSAPHRTGTRARHPPGGVYDLPHPLP
ncbi:YcaO-like family protein [Nocardioides lijunqiniae]|uniref:YcaO-like family protein n=1 Tax=Nocardioides lijunqiniae TaxID=2760832 RepID=UPI001878A279|nr:YcaO-like family protein [Nocardioides lijunqiniae]